ncbi:hypothetical protein KC19_1G049700 [Ceratodon purpureus]|uniref:Uncharacterized protein n=1 Tax=Ceratodon purpureus TaxID=3225 RepID=A0A8T0J3Y2_CERPU|nr:hypothetical protein KC19_1G049700 [Ceratodon purpureus]
MVHTEAWGGYGYGGGRERGGAPTGSLSVVVDDPRWTPGCDWGAIRTRCMRWGAGIRAPGGRWRGNWEFGDVRDVASCDPHGNLGVALAKSLGFCDGRDCGAIRGGHRVQAAASRTSSPAIATPRSIAQGGGLCREVEVKARGFCHVKEQGGRG